MANLKTTKSYEASLAKLNPAQKQAVETIEGPVMVIAGPGTGKTQVLTTRIARILMETDLRASNILALTFTESAAKNMQERLIKMIGREAYFVKIGTFHSFCSEVIAENSDFFSIRADSQPLTELETHEIFRSLIDTLDLEVLRPAGDKYRNLRTMMKVISDLKREGVNWEEFSELVEAERERIEGMIESGEIKTAGKTREARKRLAKNKEMSWVYQAYEARLREKARYDFDDMIMLVVEAMEREPDLLANYQEQFQYILVDEYQDTNSGQNRVVELLASGWGEEANVFVVGDPNQSIYRFQGANLENVLGFVKKFPRAEVINLDKGYRCSRRIYEAASELMWLGEAESGGRGEGINELIKPIKAARAEEGAKLSWHEAANDTTEMMWLVEKMQELHAAGVEWKEMAVLYRNNQDSERVIEALEKMDIPYSLEGGVDLLAVEEINQFLNLLRLIDRLDKEDGGAIFWQVVFYNWLGLERLPLMKLAQVCGQKYQQNVLKVLGAGWENWQVIDKGRELSEAEWREIEEFYSRLITWRAENFNLVFIAWLEKVWQESEFLNFVMSCDERVFLLKCLRTLMEQAKALNQQNQKLKVEEFLAALETMREHGIKLPVIELGVEESVKLSTAHKAKGQEWDYVFMTEVYDGKWGNNKERGSWHYPEGILSEKGIGSTEDKNEEERRLFYVALTRARKEVFLSYPREIKKGDKVMTKNMSLFMAELWEERATDFTAVTDEMIKMSETEFIGELVKAGASLTAGTEEAGRKAAERRTAEKEYLAEVVRGMKLTPTLLNQFLKDDQSEFVYSLLRIPQEVTSSALSYGNAIHAALRYLYGEAEANLEGSLGVFRAALDREILTDLDRKIRLRDGEKLLREYWEEYFREGAEKVKPEIVALEKSFGKEIRVILDEDIALQGRIDRIDRVAGEKELVRVRDYKTGAAVGMAEIESTGKNPSASARERELVPKELWSGYKRQLLFYKVLTDLDPSWRHTAVSGVLDYVDKKERASYAVREIEFKEEEVGMMKELIRRVMMEIRSLRFWEEFGES